MHSKLQISILLLSFKLINSQELLYESNFSKLPIVYYNIENSFELIVNNCNCDTLDLSYRNEKIVGKKCKFVFTPKDTGIISINFGRLELHFLSVQLPTPSFNIVGFNYHNRSNLKLDSISLIFNKDVFGDKFILPKYIIKGFEFELFRDMKSVMKENIIGNKFPDKLRNSITKLNSNEYIEITNLIVEINPNLKFILKERFHY